MTEGGTERRGVIWADCLMPNHNFIGYTAIPEEELRDRREHGHTGDPLGNATFLKVPERTVGRRWA